MSTVPAPPPTVLFVCVHNAGCSQMAAGYLAALVGDRVRVRSAGSLPAEQINPVAVAAMAEDGIDITAGSPKPLTPDAVQAADGVITMGCGDTCPIIRGKRYDDWDPYPVLGWLVSPMSRIFLLQTCRCTLRLTSPVSAKFPISSIIPPRFSISMPSTNERGVLAMCSTTSAPRPPVSSRMRSPEVGAGKTVAIRAALWPGRGVCRSRVLMMAASVLVRTLSGSEGHRILRRGLRGHGVGLMLTPS